MTKATRRKERWLSPWHASVEAHISDLLIDGKIMSLYIPNTALHPIHVSAHLCLYYTLEILKRPWVHKTDLLADWNDGAEWFNVNKSFYNF